MSDKPAVLHVVWNLIRGGTEGQCARVAMACAHAGARHRVAVFRREGFFLDEVEAVCGPVYTFDIRTLKSPATLTRIWALSRFIRTERIDVVHCWDADAAVFGSLAARWAGVPFLTSRRDLGEIYARWKLRLMDRADRRATAVVVNADAIRARLVAGGLRSEKIVTIPNLLDVAEWDALLGDPLPTRFRLPNGQLIVSVARLDPEKDLATAIRAMARLKLSKPDARLLIAGDGRERSSLEGLVRELDLKEQVYFLGDVTEVPVLLKRGVIGILTPNANEGLSNTILEYMAAGLPVVATDCGGNAELVQNGETGFIVPVGSVDKLADAMGRLLDQPGEAARMGRRGRALIEQRHRPELVADRFLQLYANSTR